MSQLIRCLGCNRRKEPKYFIGVRKARVVTCSDCRDRNASSQACAGSSVWLNQLRKNARLREMGCGAVQVPTPRLSEAPIRRSHRTDYMRTVGVRLPAETIKALADRADAAGVSSSDVARSILRAELVGGKDRTRYKLAASFTVRLSAEMRAELAERAGDEGITTSEMARDLLEAMLRNRGAA